MSMKISFISLGCDKNLVDSEKMLTLVRNAGHEVVAEGEEADIIVINTCCFIHDAKEESIEAILEVAELKKEGLVTGIIVTGCLAERYKEEIQKEIEEVDSVLGTASYGEIVKAVSAIERQQKYNKFTDLREPLEREEIERISTSGNHLAYLKIAEGCNKGCSYCIIPKVRGPFRSFTMEQLLDEAKYLASQGAKELILVAQETTLYGVDIYGEKKLPELLRRLCKVEGIEWIRLLYAYPEEITEQLIQVMKEEEKICSYIDMPIQHSSDAVLKRMGRRTNQKELKEKIALLRREIPDITIRTTLISGFPGETREDQEIQLDFVNEMEFDRLGVFTYSREEGTRADKMEDQIDEDIKRSRRDEIMELQQEISYEKNEALVGKTIKVLVEGYLYEEDIYVGRSEKDAPKVDGCVFFTSEEEVISGDFVFVKITEANEYDLIGDVIYGNELTK